MKTLIKIFLFGIVALIILVAIGIFFVLNTGKEVDTVWGEEDLKTGLEKSKIDIENIEEINLESLAKGNFSTQETNDIDDHFTSKEISALISAANNKKGPIKDVKVSFNDDGKGEVSFRLSENFVDFLREQITITNNLPWEVEAAEDEEKTEQDPEKPSLTTLVIDYITSKADNKPVYATGELSRGSDNSVNINIESLTLGRIPLPQDAIDKVEYETVKVVNSIISPENGFHIEALEIRDDSLYYKGTLPAEIQGQKL